MSTAIKPVYVIEWRSSNREGWYREDMDEYASLGRAREVARTQYANPEEYADGNPPQVRIVRIVATVIEQVMA